eukprot:28481-Prymnesium_polylepis.1
MPQEPERALHDSFASRASTVEHTDAPDAITVFGTPPSEFFLKPNARRAQTASFFEPEFVHLRNLGAFVPTGAKQTLDDTRQTHEVSVPAMPVRPAMPAEWASSSS